MKIKRYGDRWLGRQKWSNILFAHWPVDKNKLQQFVPYPFRVMTHADQAYLTVVAFKASNSRPRYFPEFCSFRPFWQVNIRTYIRFGHERGIYIFSMYSHDLLAVKMGQLPGLSYVHSRMSINKNSIYLAIDQCEDHGNLVSDIFLNYKLGEKLVADERLNFLTDHYRLYFMRGNKIIKGKISHDPWQFRHVTGHMRVSGKIDHMAANIEKPILLAAENQESFLYPLQKIGQIASL